ncbi:MAG: DUF4832 domain-containing protein [Verrucomicrobiales bacterium]|nr:DUF4832 domain-containing protein [Verrucomicrobiales bacterium]MCP5558973.1 DUF4832 domain-containing protein [Verrucomicrobiaceae bacterium]
MNRVHLLALLFGVLWPVEQTLAEERPVSCFKHVSVRDGWVTVAAPEFEGALNNPLKGFRDYKENGYGLLERQYIKWSDIEVCAGDSVERIIAHTNKITETKGRRFEDLNIKLVPRVYLDWDGSLGSPKDPKQHWPADLQTFDYDSPAFYDRLRSLIAKLGEAWDDDPRIFAVQMGLIGKWGEHHSPAPTAEQRRLLAESFRKAFKHKPVLVRNTDAEFIEAGFGIYYDTFATISREPPDGSKDQFPWQATHVYPDIWKRGPIEGEVEYNWQKSRESAKPKETFGRTPDETMIVPAYRRYMIDKVRRYHASYLGWIDNYDDKKREVLEGAGELQKAFGYRFVIDSLSYPINLKPGGDLTVKLTVRNTGSAPFYLDWPVGVALLDATTRKPVWSSPLAGIDIRKWRPGEDWDSNAFAYRKPAKTYSTTGTASMPEDLKPGQYLLAVSILDREGGLVPSVRFASANYLKGGWHPFGFIGIGEPPSEVELKDMKFDSPAFDDSLSYRVPEKLRSVQTPPLPKVTPVSRWSADPKKELINPWRYWSLHTGSKTLEKQILNDGPVENAAGHRVIRVTGDFGDGSKLEYTLLKDGKLPRGRYRFACRIRGTGSLTMRFDVADGWRGVTEDHTLPLTAEWREHLVEFEIKTAFKDETSLRFQLPKNVKGEFDLTDPRLLRTN